MATAPMRPVRTISGNQPLLRRHPEDETETFLLGTPVQLNAGGFVIAWDGVTEAFGILGISSEPAKNLTTEGVAKQLSSGAVINQPLAVKLQRPFFDPDGKSGVFVANDDTVFYGQVGPAQTASRTQAVVGDKFGITIDTDNHWFVDLTDTVDIVCQIVGLDPNDTRGVYFVIIPASQQAPA